MKLSLANIIVILFIIVSLGDIVTTFMVTVKHGIDFETNPMGSIGIPLWGMFTIKILFFGIMLWIILKHYNRVNIYIRYYLIYFLLLFTILQGAVAISNYEVYDYDVGEIVPIPPEQRTQVYKEQVLDMKVIERVTPQPMGFKIPLMFSLFIYNLFAFAVWVSFEKKI